MSGITDMKISVRQICFIMLAYTAVSKFILYPTALSFNSGRDLLFSSLIDFLIQGVIIWAVSFLCSRTDKTFFKLIEGTLGKVVARIIYGLFALFFIVATVIPLFEQKVYVQAIFYDTIPSLLIFLPFFAFSVYAACKGFKNIGRCADVCLPLFLVSMLFIFAMSLGEVNWQHFFPVLKTPLNKVFGGSLITAFRFVEPCWLLMFMGHFEYKKHDALKITLSYAGGALFTLLVLATFYGIYGDIAASRQFAISKISLFFPAIELIGRIDLIALYILEAVMLFALVINIQFAVHCIIKCTGYGNRAVLSLAVNGVLLIMLIFLNNSLDALLGIWSQWMWIAFVIFANIIPLLTWTMRKRDKNEG